MPISRELMGIPTSTMATLPVNFAGLCTHLPRTACSSSQFHGHFLFTKLREQGPNRLDDGLFHLPLDRLQRRFALLPLQFPCHKLYTHAAEYSLV